MRHLLPNLIVFTRTLRAAGVRVRPGGVHDAVRALAEVGVTSRRDVRDALRAVLVFRREDLIRFDLVFERFWRVWPEKPGTGPQPMQRPVRTRTTVRLLAPAEQTAEGGNVRDEPVADMPAAIRTYSPDSGWHRKDFATFTADDVEEAKKALAALTWTSGERVTRRWETGRGVAVDWRRLLRANARHGHELLIVPRRTRRMAPRPLILICDVSGSMDPYTRMLMQFAHAMAGRRRRMDVFVFSTRLTRVTRQVAASGADAALQRVALAVDDWSGGTRIGEAIRSFNVQWARRILNRGPVVLLISDGWDLGEPELLAREMARLQRSVSRLVWLNPLLGSPGYEPLTRGMRAALPHVDDFLPVHNMESLEKLAAHLNTLDTPNRTHRTRPGAQWS
jgi:uncharacterized protein with von Willebrand factor type A (vWA) domain